MKLQLGQGPPVVSVIGLLPIPVHWHLFEDKMVWCNQHTPVQGCCYIASLVFQKQFGTLHSRRLQPFSWRYFHLILTDLLGGLSMDELLVVVHEAQEASNLGHCLWLGPVFDSRDFLWVNRYALMRHYVSEVGYMFLEKTHTC